MASFIVFFIVIEGLICLSYLFYLAKGVVPPRTLGGVAVDLAFTLVFIAWAVWLLASEGRHA